MEANEYQVKASITCTTDTWEERVKLALLGMQGELGEITEPIKKYFYSNKGLDIIHVREEIGDFCWYLAILCNCLNIELSEVFAENIDKVLARYPDKVKLFESTFEKEGPRE